MDKENEARKSDGACKNLFDLVIEALTFFLKFSRSTSLKIRSSAARIKTGKFVTKLVSVFSAKSCIAVFSCANVKLMPSPL